MSETTQILKVDDAGRVQTPPEKRREILEEFERSGMTGAQLARHIRVKYPTMMACCRRRGIDPLTYLRDVLTRLPSATNWTVAQLTPENWLKTRRARLQAAA